MKILSWREKKEQQRALRWPPTCIPVTIKDWSVILTYNPRLYNKLVVLDSTQKEAKKLFDKKVRECSKTIINVAGKVKNPTAWWVCRHKDLPAPSSAEQLIIDALNKYSVKWFREVEFAGCKLSDWGYARFDIYIPDINMVIEYDGEQWHNKPENIAKDKMKTTFCETHNISITRYNKKHYYNIEKCIKELMDKYNIKRK